MQTATTFTHAADLPFRLADISLVALYERVAQHNECACTGLRCEGFVFVQVGGFDGPHEIGSWWVIRERDGALVDVICPRGESGAAVADTVRGAMDLNARPLASQRRRVRFVSHPAGDCRSCA